MKLILARHGNTFNPDDKTVWTGSANDLPLVPKGIEQAEAVGHWLRKNNIEPDVVFSGSLKRVHDFVKISIDVAGITRNPIIDVRLNEIDYGAWTGISDEEVIEKFGITDLQNWREKSIFPTVGWGETEESVIRRISTFVDFLKQDHQDDTVYVVSSNGTLRYFLKALDEKLFQDHVKIGDFTVKTGHVCVLDVTPDHVTVLAWNKKPE